MPEWHSTWHRMRGVTPARVYMTWAEFDGLLRSLGISISQYHVRRAVAAAPPAKQHTANRYTQAHVRMVRAYARRKWGVE
jgi:hypothetical protein